MAYSESLARRIELIVARRRGVTQKKMFGGIGFLLHGNLLVGVWKQSLIVRLSAEEGRAALVEPHVAEFDITGRPLTGWALVEPEGVETEAQLSAWIERSFRYVEGLPKKEAGQSSAAKNRRPRARRSTGKH